MKTRTKISSNAPWESIVGYSRAVRVGNHIEISGTTAVMNNMVQHIGDAEGQTHMILSIIEDAITKAGGSLQDIVRTRIYITNIEDWEVVGKVHGKFFSDIRPASTMLAVAKLISDDMLVEIEATAIVSS